MPAASRSCLLRRQVVPQQCYPMDRSGSHLRPTLWVRRHCLTSLGTTSEPSSNVADVNVRVQRSKWQNPRLALDVNADTFISPIDALLIINRLNDRTFERNLPLSNFVPPPFLDTNGDEIVSPLDALLVINFLNASRRAGGGGEGEANLSATTYAMMVTPQQMISTVGTQVVEEVQSALAETLSNITSETASGKPTGSNSNSWLGWTGLEKDDDAIEGLFCSSDEDKQSVVSAIDDYFESIGPYEPE